MSIPAEINFTKLTAAGNDFVCIDNCGGGFDPLLASPGLPSFVRAVCRRGLGVGCDGLIFAGPLGNGAGVDICARFFEPDGTETELCGNGTACFTYWAITSGLVSKREVKILTAAGTATGKLNDDEPGRVCVCVPEPQDMQAGLELEIKGEPWWLDYIVTGVPHAVAYVENLEQLDVSHWGPGIRRHPHFQPRGVNANFVQILDVGRLAVRTFEYGVEAETLACGTGSAAAAILSCLRYGWPEPYRSHEKPVEVMVRGGEVLKVWFCGAPGSPTVTDVCLETRVRAMYDGRLRAEFIAERVAAVPR